MDTGLSYKLEIGRLVFGRSFNAKLGSNTPPLAAKLKLKSVFIPRPLAAGWFIVQSQVKTTVVIESLDVLKFRKRVFVDFIITKRDEAVNKKYHIVVLYEFYIVKGSQIDKRDFQ